MTAHQRGDPDLPPGPARDIVDLFRRLLAHKPLTRGQISVGTGLSRSHLSEVLRGRKSPSPDAAGRIAEYLGTSADAVEARQLAERLVELNRFHRRGRGAGRPPAAPVGWAARGRAPQPRRRATADSGRYIVGRQQEVDEFDALLDGRVLYKVLNIYGPGGIGKTEVVKKLLHHARSHAIPTGTVDVGSPDISVDWILDAAVRTLCEGADEPLTQALSAFSAQLGDFHLVTRMLEQTGGVDQLFDPLGQVRDPTGLPTDADGRAWSDRLRPVLRTRFALDRYLRQAEQSLADGFAAALDSVVDGAQTPVALILDTYEDIGALDNWICRSLVPALPTRVRVVIVGRNQLTKTNFDWFDHDNQLHMRPLPELAEDGAKQYLSHFGVTDSAILDKIFRFTGGYPLLLVLVRLLAREAGGWAAIGELEHSSDRDIVASRLLERILREEKVREVRDVLEKCAIAPWINPEVITALLGLRPAAARRAYEQVQRHSFMEPHPHGVKLHDKIRELLAERLKFTSEDEYDRLEGELLAYYAAKAGLTNHE